jgi:hypothetical protein
MCECIHTTDNVKEAAVVFTMSYISLQEPEDNNCTNRDSNKERFPFDYTNEKAVSVLRQKGFKHGTKGIENWIQCAKAAVDCCDNMEEKDINPGMEFETYFRT